MTASPVDPDAPNGGQWFAVEGKPGETVAVVAQVANRADVEQSVRLYLTDLSVADDRATVGEPGVGVGGWGAFDQPDLRLGPRSVERATFRMTVPADAEPGDHIGAVVAESGAAGGPGGVGVVKRVAARLYVTVPGEAAASVEIDELETRVDRALLPRAVMVTFLVRNTGKVRVDASVEVNGRAVDGPAVVMSRSAEGYEARVPLSVWGGTKSIDVRVRTTTRSGEGPTARDETSLLVVPWWILLAAFLLVVGAVALRDLAKRLR